MAKKAHKKGSQKASEVPVAAYGIDSRSDGMPVQTSYPAGLSARKFLAVRIGLFAVACVLIVVAMVMLAFTSSQLSRTQQLASSLIQTEQRADVLVIASFDDGDRATKLQRDSVVDLLERSHVNVDVEYLDVLSSSTNPTVATSAETTPAETTSTEAPAATAETTLTEAPDAATDTTSTAAPDATTSADASSTVAPQASSAPATATADLSTYGSSLANSQWGQALAQKIRDHGTYAAVICIDDDALCYTEALHDSLFPQTPVVFMGVNDTTHAQRAFEAGYATGVMETTDAAALVAAAQKMCTSASHIVVLTDNTATGVGDRVQFQQAIANPDDDYTQITQLPVAYLNASLVSRADLAKQVSELDNDAMLIYLGARTDAAGNAYGASQTAYYISQAASQPIFAVGFGGVGEGFVGSAVIDYEQEGTRAGEITIAILNGTRPADIPLESVRADGMVFDTQALSNYGIATSSLPSSAATLSRGGITLDTLRPIFLPVTLLILGIACIVAFAILGYRRTARQLADVAAQRSLLERRFYTDNLTDMPNMQWLTAYAGSDDSSQVRAIVEVALPDVYKLNQTRGAGTAEEVIKVLAGRLNGLDKLFLVRPDRDEFILGFARELKPSDSMLDDLKALLDQAIKLPRGTRVSRESITIEPCIGVYNREPGTSIEEMVSGVDLAIRQAKQVGMAGEVIFYDKEINRAVEHKLEITQRIKKAIDKDGFILFYQPQVELATNEVVGYDALIRMRGDYFTPEQFIPVAEANGQIEEIDRIVTKKVVLQLATWRKRKQRLRPISINYAYSQLHDSAFDGSGTQATAQAGMQAGAQANGQLAAQAEGRTGVQTANAQGQFGGSGTNAAAGDAAQPEAQIQLHDERYVNYVKELLDERGVAHDLFRVDIKESLFLNDKERATKFVDELREAGFGVAIDGFGAGYTSVSSMLKIPADVVKIDRAITATFLAGGDDEVVRNLVRVAHEAEKLVVVEGVETAEQLQLCREMGCDVVQGFYFTEPLLPEQAVRYKPEDVPPAADAEKAASNSAESAPGASSLASDTPASSSYEGGIYGYLSAELASDSEESADSEAKNDTPSAS